MEFDASLQGLGARWGLQVYTITIPIGYKNFNIVPLEMVSILAAIREWGNQWMYQKVSIACDNEAMVQVLSSGETRDFTLAAIARNIQRSDIFQVKLMSLPTMGPGLSTFKEIAIIIAKSCFSPC